MHNLKFYDLHSSAPDLKKDVLNGLSSRPKAIPPKFFYDERGSFLFEQITKMPEYYPTRTEVNLINEYSSDMASQLPKKCLLIDLGSGSSEKVRLIIDALQPAAYMPIDISKEYLRQSAQKMAQDYPNLDIHAVCADYSNEFRLPYCPESMQRVAFFPGSSIGNFDPAEAQEFLRRVAGFLGKNGTLLIGVDLKKDPALLNNAYNDSQGVTASFNMNLLRRINDELNSDFDLSYFYHHAFYNESLGRIEMHLVSDKPQKVSMEGKEFIFAEGESIHTESSYKYTVDEFDNLSSEAGFQLKRVWVDSSELFSIHCLLVRPAEA
uniref:Dimethylhistidine N-methyltransferase n=1 Tax=Candidatus Kentrum sp. LFY TaxID=2126342 RepID=A0A450U503_9GAMM|nr:MAG: dimethylhistidine N-methyltransferase [Candidatus Kentron sp. LFY]